MSSNVKELPTKRAMVDNATKPIAEIKVSPQGQQNLSLGNFTDHNPPKGFAVEPDLQAEESVLTRIKSLGTPGNYELVLQVANYSDRTVTAKVWAL